MAFVYLYSYQPISDYNSPWCVPYVYLRAQGRWVMAKVLTDAAVRKFKPTKQTAGDPRRRQSLAVSDYSAIWLQELGHAVSR